jgi:hypothetical protein
MKEKVWEVYKKACVKYLQETWGTNLVSVIEHTDEHFAPDLEHDIKPETLHRHLHFACVPAKGINFAEIHPGIKAKRAADKAYGVTKIPEGFDERGFEIFKKEGRQAGDRAYRQAMKLVQDDFFIHVGNPFGLLRYGPKRSRLSREEIVRRDHEKRLKQKHAVELAEQEEKTREQAKEIEKVKHDLEKLLFQKQNLEDGLKKRETIVSAREKAIAEQETNLHDREQRQEDFERGVKTSLKGWTLPKPAVGEFAGHYLKRVAGEVMGIVQRALNIINDYGRKKAELEKQKAILEAETTERKKQEASTITTLEKTYSEKVMRLKAAYEKLKSKIRGIKTLEELAVLQKDLAPEQPDLSR